MDYSHMCLRCNYEWESDEASPFSCPAPACECEWIETESSEESEEDRNES